MNENRIYIAIDLKSFYASVECMERQLDPLTTNLNPTPQKKTLRTKQPPKFKTIKTLKL